LGVSWPWIVLLAAAVVIVVAAEWGRMSASFGAEARRRRERQRRKAKFRVVRDEDEEFVASVQRDLDRLPTIEERESHHRD
jgi:predicted nucleic acid-binding protein